MSKQQEQDTYTCKTTTKKEQNIVIGMYVSQRNKTKYMNIYWENDGYQLQIE